MEKSEEFLQQLAKRIAQLIPERGVAQKAKEWGVADQTLRNVVNADKCPSSELIAQIAQAAGVSLNWLLLGQGPMHLPAQAPDTVAEQPGDYDALDILDAQSQAVRSQFDDAIQRILAAITANTRRLDALKKEHDALSKYIAGSVKKHKTG